VKDRKQLIAIVIVVLVIMVAAVWLLNTRDKKRFSWRESYKNNLVQPYGTSVLYSLLKDLYPDGELIESKSPLRNVEKWDSPLNYVAIGEDIYYSYDDMWKLLEIVEQGNSALIVCKYPPSLLLSTISEEICYDYFYSTLDKEEVYLNFQDAPLKSKEGYGFQFYVQDQIESYQWNYYDSLLCDSAIVKLGTLDTLTNFVSIPYGDGQVLLHSVPLAFSNFHLLRQENLSYVEKVFSFLPPADIYWDEHSKVALYQGDSERGLNSPLQYIMGQQSLRWAWYIILALVLLYILSFSKRKQKIIPVMETNENTSIEFTEAIGELYYQQQNHQQLGLLKMKLFLEYIRNHYHLNTSQLDEALIKKIIAKSQIAHDHVKRIFDMHSRMLENSEVSDYLLIEFNRALEYFYDNCK